MMPRYIPNDLAVEQGQSPQVQKFKASASQLAALGRKIDRHWDIARAEPLQLDASYDFLASSEASETFWSGINRHLMRSAKPVSNAALVTSARNEGPYLVEWVAHHLSVGFKEIFIYANNNDDESDKLLELMHGYRLITLISNQVGEGVSPQKKAFEHAVHFLRPLRRYEWVAFLDVDELLIPDEKYHWSIDSFLDAYRANYGGEQPAAIFFHWDWYHDIEKIYYEPKIMLESFTKRSEYAVVKSLVHLPSVSHMHHVHAPDLDLKFINSSFNSAVLEPWRSFPIDYSGGKINHYFHKSFQEFANKSYRGIGDSAVNTAGRALSNFFSMAPTWHSTLFPPPFTLLEAVKVKIADMYSMPGIVQAQAKCLDAHKRISEIVCGPDISVAYESARRALNE